MKNGLKKIFRMLFLIFMLILFAAGCGSTSSVQMSGETPAARNGSTSQGRLDSQDTAVVNQGRLPVREYWPTQEWKEALPEDQGMDSSRLNMANEYIKEDETCLHSLLVVRNGYLIFEQYYNGYTKDKKNALQSVTKSVISALTGIAIDKGFLEGVDQKAVDIFPEYFKGNEDKTKEEISIEHLLTMSSGLEWQQSGKIRNKWNFSPDMQKYYIGLPLETEPGKVFNYSAGSTHLLSAILKKTSGMSAENFAEKYLFSHLEITEKRWDKDIQGNSMGNAGLYLTPRDMAKFGYLFLNNGVWEGKQIISPEWVSESSKKQISTGTDFADYGYCWWIKTIDGYECFFALGYGGQYIVIVPELDIVVVMTSRWDKESNGPDYFIDIIDSYVIKAVI